MKLFSVSGPALHWVKRFRKRLFLFPVTLDMSLKPVPFTVISPKCEAITSSKYIPGRKL